MESDNHTDVSVEDELQEFMQNRPYNKDWVENPLSKTDPNKWKNIPFCIVN